MADVRIAVNGREIDEGAIAAEAQHHPAPDAESAWQAAAEALVVRRLLLDEADRLGIGAERFQDAEGRPLAADEARIEALLASQVQCPEADEDIARRYYETHKARFLSAKLLHNGGHRLQAR